MHAQYRSRRDEDGKFVVQSIDTYLRQRPDLVRLRTISAPGNGRPRWEELTNLDERVDIELPKELDSILQRFRSRAEQSGELLDAINYQRLLLHTVPSEALAEQSRLFVDFLNSVRFDDGGNEGPFLHTGVHLVDLNPALLHRLKIPSVLLRIAQDPQLKNGDLSHMRDLDSGTEQLFASAGGLYEGVLMFDAYLAPLLAAGSPGVWAVSTTRSFGSLIFSLGTFVSGTKGDAAEMLQLLALPGATDVVTFPALPRNAASSALQWWTEQLNMLFSVLSDFSTFTSTNADYQPAKHLEALLTTEQVFRRTTSMLVSHRDTNARRALLFTVLDSLEGLRGTNLLTMCNLTHARKTMTFLEEALPSAAAALLLPAARRGIQALEEMKEGFFIRRQLQTERVHLYADGVEIRALSVEEAVARYLKVLRDATHGHGSNKQASRPISEALIAHHDGNVPHDVGLLGYLYLLDLLAQPQDRTRARLHRSSG